MPKQKLELTPHDTYWIKPSPEGEPPPGVLLLLKTLPKEIEDDEVGVYSFGVGYYSPIVHTFLTMDELALLESYNVLSYHIITDEDGKTVSLIP